MYARTLLIHTAKANCDSDDGSMSREKREISLEKIKTVRSIKVILISFKAGSTGALCRRSRLSNFLIVALRLELDCM